MTGALHRMPVQSGNYVNVHVSTRKILVDCVSSQRPLFRKDQFAQVATSILLLMVGLKMPSLCATVQVDAPQPAKTLVAGVVHDSAGRAVAGAAVVFEENGGVIVTQAITRPDGTFTCVISRAGIYTVRANKSGFGPAPAVSLSLTPGEKKHIDLVLKAKAGDREPSSKASDSAAMEFTDDPNFTVAGVTDWTAVGGHGADTNLRTSETLAKDAIALKSERPAGASPGGVAINGTGADLVQARERLKGLLARNNTAEGHRLLGDIDEQLNDPLSAEREYEEAVRLDPNEESYFRWGTELLLHRAIEPAVQVFAKGSRLHPKSVRMLAGWGAALYAAGSYEEAALRVCAASDLGPDDSHPYLFLAEMENAAPGPLPCANEKLARFAHDRPENALASYYYARSLWKRRAGPGHENDFSSIESLLNRALAVDPKLGAAYLQLGILCFSQGRLAEAVSAYQKAIVTSPQLGEAHYRLAMAYKRQGEQAKAEQEIRLHEQIEKREAEAVERRRREVQQFLVEMKAPQ